MCIGNETETPPHSLKVEKNMFEILLPKFLFEQIHSRQTHYAFEMQPRMMSTEMSMTHANTYWWKVNLDTPAVF